MRKQYQRRYLIAKRINYIKTVPQNIDMENIPQKIDNVLNEKNIDLLPKKDNIKSCLQEKELQEHINEPGKKNANI